MQSKIDIDMGFFKKLSGTTSEKLVDVVQKRSSTGFVFIDINDDLGIACEQIMKSSVEVQMAYAYARRSAAAAMYMQGILTRDIYEHVCVVFKGLQVKTGHSVEFQRQAFYDSIDFMQTYNPLITALFVKVLVPMTREYEPASNQISDRDLFVAVIDAAHSEQEEARLKNS